MAIHDIIMAAGGSAATSAAVYVEDVFSTYLYTGNGSSQTISNGIALGDNVTITGSTLTNLGGNFDASYPIGNLTNGVLDTGSANVGYVPSANGYLDVYANLGAPAVVTAYKIAPQYGLYNLPISFRVLASNNATTWTTIVSSVTVTGLANSTLTTFTFSNSTAYQYWRLQCLDYGSGSAGVALSEWEVVGTATGAGKGGLVWINNRQGSSHALIDTIRGSQSLLSSNTTSPPQINDPSWGMGAFNVNGFSFISGSSYVSVNNSGAPHVSWTFRRQAKFFDILTVTGPAGYPDLTVSHSLGCLPGMVIIKSIDGYGVWHVWHRSLPSTDALQLQSSNASSNVGTLLTVTSSTITIKGGALGAGVNYVVYLFADSNSGGFGAAGTDSVVACGSYTGNGVNNGGPIVNLGWEPQWLLIKATGSTTFSSWFMLDNMRGFTADAQDQYLYANTADAEQGPSPFPKITATGFQPVHTSIANASGINYIYLAIRRGPMKTPTDATKVFAPVAYTGTGSTTTLSTGIVSDLSMFKARTSGGQSAIPLDRLRGGRAELATPYNSAEYAWPSNSIGFDNNSGLNLNGNGIGGNGLYNSSSMVAWSFRRAPGFFDVVCYTGTGAWPLTVSHNLTVAPELIIIKNRSGAYDWTVGSVYLPDGWNNPMSQILALNNSSAAQQQGYIHSVDASTFKVVGNNWTGMSGSNYVAYLFATCPGVSKVGSYTGNGSSQTINCGFAAGARFILIKRTDSAGDWYVWDTARGITTGGDPYLKLNTTDVQVTGYDLIDPDSSGFIVNQYTGIDCNVSSATYIYLAIA